MTDLSITAAAWLSRGQAEEAAGTPSSLEAAVRSYDAAIALLNGRLGKDPGSAQHDLAIAWMNRGNALLKLNSAESIPAASSAYDQAIVLLDVPVFEKNFPARNSLGAAWMNRGLAFHRQGGTARTRENIDEALRSHRAAITALQTLPRDASPWYRHNLAAAWMNLANTLLDSNAADRFATSAEAARIALAVVREGETTDPTAAELSLKARRCLCDALGHQLSANETAGIANEATAAETSGTVDDALALIRRWTQPGGPDFRLLTERFFRFGAHFYRIYQPHFLAEFILENLDPENSAGAAGRPRELYAIADETLVLALEALRKQPVLILGDLRENRLLETSRTLQAAQVRLDVLRRRA